MNILIIHQSFYPEEYGVAKSCTEIAEYFTSKNHNVTVVTEFPNRSFISFKGSKCNLKRIDYYKGINIHRLKNRFVYSSNPLSRILAYLTFSLMSAIYVIKLRKKFDICITMESITSGIPGAIIGKIKKIPHHFFCTDMMPELGIVSGMVNNKLIIRMAKIVEKLVYNNSKAVFAVTDSMARNIKQKNNNKNVFVLSDWINVDFFNKNRYKYINYLQNLYNIKGKQIILYIGNIGFLQNTRTFVEAAKMMEESGNFKEYLFVIGGSGVQKKQLEELCKEYDLKNMIFIGVVERKYVPSFLQLSSYLIINFVSHPHMALYNSGKIFDYIIAEKPVIAGAIGELAQIVQDNNLGVVAQPSDPVDFYQKFIKITNTKYNINNEVLIKKYSIENVLANFYKRIQSINYQFDW